MNILHRYQCLWGICFLCCWLLAPAPHALADATVDEYIEDAPQFYYPTGNAGASEWSYTTSFDSGWEGLDCGAEFWTDGAAGFGRYPAAGDVIGTSWSTPDIYLRRWIELTQEQIDDLAFYGRWDDTIEVYINGVLAFDATSWSSRYRFAGIDEAARAALQPGWNLFAVHCHDYGGGQYIDLGLTRNPLADLPFSGQATTPAVAQFGEAVRRFMIDNVIPAGTLAVMKGDQVVASYGLGYAEQSLQTPVQPDAVLRLASNDKVVTAGIVWNLIAEGAVDPVTGQTITSGTLVFPLLEAHGVRTPSGGGFALDRINQITVQHLLDHRSGLQELPWVYDLASIWGGLDVEELTDRHNAGYLGSVNPDFPPGSSYRYCSSGYFLLRYLAELVTGDVELYLQDTVLAGTGTSNIHISRERAADRLATEPWYATNEDSYPRWVYLDEYYALGAGAEALVRYLRRYHITLGSPLVDPATGEWAPLPDDGLGVYYGSMAGSWSVSIQRRYDEVGIAVIFNQNDYYDAITDRLMAIADGIDDSEWGAGAATVASAGINAPSWTSFPNPASGSTTFRFAPRRAGSVTLEIYDLRGRRLRTIEGSVAATEPMDLRWDGLDDRGLPLAGGTYLARILDNSGVVESGKFQMVR